MQSWLSSYRETLLSDVVPFWMTHGLGSRDGALNNCLDDSGNVISTDRYLWSQGRALWTFSALYRRIEARQEWLDVAHGIYRYLCANGRDDNGHWMYRLDSLGNVVEADTSIFVDAFVMAGLGEYFAATNDEGAAQLALETFENTYARLQRPGSYGISPYALPEGTKTLGIPMVFSFFYHNLGKALGRKDISQIGYTYALELIRDFFSPEKNAFRELVPVDGASPERSLCIPGHVIEAMWFLIAIFDETGDTDLIYQCCGHIRRHLELAWDQEYGGLYLAIDLDGKDAVDWPKADCKPWWVQVEALVATAYAHIHTGEDWCLEWHGKIHDYAYSHYPVDGGEWTQWLDRYGNKSETAALPVNDPFHLPRALIYLTNLAEARAK